jgi:hypothetical protein
MLSASPPTRRNLNEFFPLGSTRWHSFSASATVLDRTCDMNDALGSEDINSRERVKYLLSTVSDDDGHQMCSSSSHSLGGAGRETSGKLNKCRDLAHIKVRRR